MSLSILSSVNSNITKYQIVAPSGLTPSLWWKFAAGSTLTSTSITNSGSITTGLTYAVDTSKASLNTTVYKYNGGSLSVIAQNLKPISVTGYPTTLTYFSICFWLNYTQNPSSIYRLFSFLNCDMFIWPNGSNHLIFWVNSNWIVSWTDCILSVNTWCHIALTFTSSGAWVLYLNGVVKKTGTYSNFASQFKTQYRFTLLNEYGFNGYMSDFMILNNVTLSLAQVTSINSNLPIPLT
jgi:hypothetical protein